MSINDKLPPAKDDLAEYPELDPLHIRMWHSIYFFFAWLYLGIGFYYDREKAQLYFCPVPCCVFLFDLPYIVLVPNRSWKNTLALIINDNLNRHSWLILSRWVVQIDWKGPRRLNAPRKGFRYYKYIE